MNRKEYFKILDNELNDRLRERIDIDKGQIIDFVVQYESFINEKWVALVRYDFAHGYFHRDKITPDGKKEKQKIDINDRKTAHTYAEQDLTERWKFYKKQYVKKLKL